MQALIPKRQKRYKHDFVPPMKEGFTRYMKNHQVHWWIFIQNKNPSPRAMAKDTAATVAMLKSKELIARAAAVAGMLPVE